MSKYSKWIGGVLGWAMGGPIGGLVGFGIGSLFDKADSLEHTQQRASAGKTRAGDFSASLLVLSAAVMKADGTVKKSELEYVKQFFIRQFGKEHTKKQLKVLQDLLNKNIPLYQVCEQINQNMQYDLKVQLIHYLFGISKADGQVDKTEVETIEQISSLLSISNKDFESIKAMFYKDASSAYKILEVDPNASDDEIKSAYRKMAVKYHPDKVSHLGDKFKKAAEEKFQKVQSAYEDIKKERGMA